jgi:hypothetical protein
MVVVQILVFGKVQGNRSQRRESRAAKMRRDKSRSDLGDDAGMPIDRKPEAKLVKSGMDGAGDSINENCDAYESDTRRIRVTSKDLDGKIKLNGVAYTGINSADRETGVEEQDTPSEASMTSDEEMMI